MSVFISIVLLVALNACGFRGDSEVKYSSTPTIKAEVSSPTPDEDYLKVPEIGVKALNKRQKRELDSTLPLKVRRVLDKAETLEVLGLSSDDKAGIGWHPDVKVSLPVGSERAELLNSFFFDASAGPNPSACFIPRHGLKATYKGKTVEVIICYQCHLFVVEGDFGEFDGGVYTEGSAAHRLLEKILRTKVSQ